jgi:hypothetical protein
MWTTSKDLTEEIPENFSILSSTKIVIKVNKT